jgi:gliding motility-associated transport system permease protein
MLHVPTIAKRELTSLFFSPVAYVVLGLFGFGTALLFLAGFAPGVPAEMRNLQWSVLWLMVPLVPAISMRLISEEYRSGTIEPLMTLPISDTQVILGKWLGAMGFLVTLMIPIAVLIAVLGFNSDPDFGPILVGMLGLLLVGGLYLAIGTFASATTQSQIIAFLVTTAMVLAFSPLAVMLARAGWVSDRPWIKHTLFYINVFGQFEDFSKGIIDLGRVVFFVSGTGLFLFFATITLQSRRWR